MFEGFKDIHLELKGFQWFLKEFKKEGYKSNLKIHEWPMILKNDLPMIEKYPKNITKYGKLDF